MKSTVQVWVFKTGKKVKIPVCVASFHVRTTPVTGCTQLRQHTSVSFSAANATAFLVPHIGGRQGKTAAGEDKRNVRLFQHAYSILNNKPPQLLADLHWLPPSQGSAIQPTLCWKRSSCFGIWWSIAHYSSNAWRNAFRQFVLILAVAHSTTLSQEVVPTA